MKVVFFCRIFTYYVKEDVFHLSTLRQMILLGSSRTHSNLFQLYLKQFTHCVSFQTRIGSKYFWAVANCFIFSIFELYAASVLLLQIRAFFFAAFATIWFYGGFLSKPKRKARCTDVFIVFKTSFFSSSGSLVI